MSNCGHHACGGSGARGGGLGRGEQGWWCGGGWIVEIFG